MTVQQEYNKQLRRVKQLVRRATKRGYVFPANVAPKRTDKITKSSVEKLAKLTPEELYKKAKYTDPITGKTVKGAEGRKIERSRASQKAAQTAKKNREEARQRLAQHTGTKLGSGKPPKASKIIITNVVDGFKILSGALKEIANWSPESHWTKSLADAKRNDKNRLSTMLASAISQFGEEEIARRLEAKASVVTSLIEEILYASGAKEGNFKDGRTQVNADLNRVKEILLDRPLTVLESAQLTEENEVEEFDE